MVRKDHWMDHASCAGVPESEVRFFPYENVRSAESHYRDAKQMCDACPVAKHCRLASLGEADGLWALLTTNERTNFRYHWKISDHTGGMAADGHRRAQVAWVHDIDPEDMAVEWLGDAAGKAWMDWYAPTLSPAEYREFIGDRQSA
jgi:hypothetical protein